VDERTPLAVAGTTSEFLAREVMGAAPAMAGSFERSAARFGFMHPAKNIKKRTIELEGRIHSREDIQNPFCSEIGLCVGERGCVSAPSSPGANTTGLARRRKLGSTPGVFDGRAGCRRATDYKPPQEKDRGTDEQHAARFS